MIKKTLILADRDEMYLLNLSNYFMEKAPQLELITFSRGDKLAQYLAQGHVVDILAVDESILTPQLALPPLTNCAKIVLSSSMTPVNGFELVRKYQKSETLLSDILLKYAEATGTTDAIRGKNNTKIAAFFSPAGGTGKTMLALALAGAGAYVGRKVLYLNQEEVDSVLETFPPSPGSLSDIYLALKTKGMNVGVKLMSSVGLASPGGFSYISGVESVTEHGEITDKELEKLVAAIRALSDFDMVVLDLSSAFTVKNMKLLECADVIFAPVTSEEAAIAKMKRFLREADFHENYQEMFTRMKLVVNRSMTSSPSPDLVASGLLNQMECVAMIPNVSLFAKQKACIAGGDALRQLMGQLLQVVDTL